jgi:hypothetical protein
MQDLNTASSKILFVTSYELKLLLRGFLLPACLGALLAYIIIFFIDVERSGPFNTIPMTVVPVVGTIIVLKLLLYTKLEKTEIHRFRFIFSNTNMFVNWRTNLYLLPIFRRNTCPFSINSGLLLSAGSDVSFISSI